jgi:uncharacterized protein
MPCYTLSPCFASFFMSYVTLLAFLFLCASFLSLWVHRKIKIWASLLALSILSGFIAGNVLLIGLVFMAALLVLWIFYTRSPTLILFIAIVAVSMGFKLHLFPGYAPFIFTDKFSLGLEKPLIGLFPLAFFVSLARSKKSWSTAAKGTLIGCLGIVVLAILATFAKATSWQFKIPSFFAIRSLSNLFLTAIPEEGFYRGFVQKTLCSYFKDSRAGKILALVLTSLLFTAAHLYWSPNLHIFAFIFLASLLYGSVYLLTEKIESAIATHFLLNLMHMLFFSYHAM